jgi:hypothetical protein
LPYALSSGTSPWTFSLVTATAALGEAFPSRRIVDGYHVDSRPRQCTRSLVPAGNQAACGALRARWCSRNRAASWRPK